MTLSILIPTIESRYQQFSALLDFLEVQPGFKTYFNIFAYYDEGQMTIGEKRQLLLEQADGDYVAFIDDDDEVTDQYIPRIIAACWNKPDVVGFKGWMTTNGAKKELWEISKSNPYKTCHQGPFRYLRFNNHLSPVKREIALKIGYKFMTHGEDYDYACRLQQSGLIRSEFFIDEFLYHYKYISKK